jgi:hypothetical protein
MIFLSIPSAVPLNAITEPGSAWIDASEIVLLNPSEPVNVTLVALAADSVSFNKALSDTPVTFKYSGEPIDIYDTFSDIKGNAFRFAMDRLNGLPTAPDTSRSTFIIPV